MLHCHKLNKAQCKLLGRKYRRSHHSKKGYCTEKCKVKSYRIDFESGRCKENQIQDESVIDILTEATGKPVKAAYGIALELSAPNRVAFETV